MGEAKRRQAPKFISNDKPGAFDKVYRDKLAQDILHVIIEASCFDDPKVGRVAHIKTSEVADAMSVVLSQLMASHKDAVSPTSLKQLVEEVSERLFRRVVEARQAGWSKGIDYVTYEDEIQ